MGGAACRMQALRRACAAALACTPCLPAAALRCRPCVVADWPCAPAARLPSCVQLGAQAEAQQLMGEHRQRFADAAVGGSSTRVQVRHSAAAGSCSAACVELSMATCNMKHPPITPPAADHITSHPTTINPNLTGASRPGQHHVGGGRGGVARGGRAAPAPPRHPPLPRLVRTAHSAPAGARSLAWAWAGRGAPGCWPPLLHVPRQAAAAAAASLLSACRLASPSHACLPPAVTPLAAQVSKQLVMLGIINEHVKFEVGYSIEWNRMGY